MPSIYIKPSPVGLLHKDTGTPDSKKIPLKSLMRAANSTDADIRKRAVFAENAKSWNHVHK